MVVAEKPDGERDLLVKDGFASSRGRENRSFLSMSCCVMKALVAWCGILIDEGGIVGVIHFVAHAQRPPWCSSIVSLTSPVKMLRVSSMPRNVGTILVWPPPGISVVWPHEVESIWPSRESYS